MFYAREIHYLTFELIAGGRQGVDGDVGRLVV